MERIFKNKGCATFVYDRIERKYLLGKDIADGVIMVVENKKYYFTDDRYFYAVKDAITELGFIPVRYTGVESLLELLSSSQVKTLYLNYDRICVSQYLSFIEKGFEIKDYSKAITLMRSIKSQAEMLNVKKACEIAQKAYHQVIKTLKIGDTEKEVKKRLEESMLKLGADGIAFNTIVAFGENSAIPHHVTCDDKLQDGDVVLIDMGCTYKGYCSDITRTAFFGKPSQKFVDDYNLVLKANIYAEENIVDGTDTFVADGYARGVLKEFDLDQYFTHSLGHGIGLEVHEYPTLSKRSKDKLVNGMVFSVEPGVYFNGEYGIRIEDTVALVDGKVERFFTDDKKLIIL